MLESVTRGVTILWEPARFPVRWAHAAEDVPPFDPSRGGDPYRGRIRGEFMSLKTRHLGGGADPPSDKWETVVELDATGEMWHASGSNYPRVVRASEADLAADVGIDEDPLSALAGLAQLQDSERFMDEVLQVAERYGLLSFADDDASLEIWRHVAIESLAHTQLLKRLQTIRGDNPAGPGKTFITSDDRDELRSLLNDLNPVHALPQLYRVRGAINESGDLDELRSHLAEMYWDAFGHQLRMYGHRGGFWEKTKLNPKLWALPVDVRAPGQLVVRTGARGWSLYQLWRIAVEDAPIRVCQGCGGLFLPRRRDALHCSDGCRMKTFRRRHAKGDEK